MFCMVFLEGTSRMEVCPNVAFTETKHKLRKEKRTSGLSRPRVLAIAGSSMVNPNVAYGWGVVGAACGAFASASVPRSLWLSAVASACCFVLVRNANQEIDVTRRSRVSIQVVCVSPNHHKPNVGRDHQLDKLFEILGKLHSKVPLVA